MPQYELGPKLEKLRADKGILARALRKQCASYPDIAALRYIPTSEETSDLCLALGITSNSQEGLEIMRTLKRDRAIAVGAKDSIRIGGRNYTLGPQLREWRERAGIDAEALAKETPRYRDVEGSWYNPTHEELDKALDALGVDSSERIAFMQARVRDRKLAQESRDNSLELGRNGMLYGVSYGREGVTITSKTD